MCGFAQHSDNFISITLLGKIVDSLDIERAKDVISEAHGHENARDHNVTEAQKWELGGILGPVRGEEDFDGGVNALSDCQHDIGAEDKENVIEEESCQHHEAVLEVAQEDHLDGVDWEKDGQRVVEDPRLGHDVDSYAYACNQ